ncbi:MAG: flagellar basal body-associated FliL family protein [Pseudohongiella sp.]|uniref:flagellar basal body-associated protein FliL n=1 Tax=Pseudohongiella sp. TaxID=1979412 RepID=UPI00349FD3AF
MTRIFNAKNKLWFAATGLATALCLTPVGLTPPVWAAAAPAPEDGEAGSGMANLIYYNLGPSFITNYDGAGRLKYLKTDVSVRIQPGSAPVLERHLPYIRNRLVTLLSKQLEEDLTSIRGKEQLRADAISEIKQSLDLLEGPGASSQIINLYFTSFVIQR